MSDGSGEGGMGAKHFLLLSRINMVRRALRESTRAEATVIEIATRYGFWQFGRLAVEYRTLFGESPSASALDLPNPQHGQLPPSAVQVYVLDRTCQCLHRTGFRDRDPSCRSMEAGSAGVPGRASGLAWLEEHLEHPICSHFDLIAGTSTGGIIAIGLGLGLPATEILRLYEEHGPAIFDRHHKALHNWVRQRLRGLRHWFGTKYSSEVLHDALAKTSETSSRFTTGTATVRTSRHFTSSAAC